MEDGARPRDRRRIDGFDYAAALAACARRDEGALGAIYERGGFLLAVARRITRRDETARDALHDAFLDVWQRAGTFDPARGDGRAWIVAVLRHRALKAVRRSGREAALDPEAQAAVADEAPDAFALLARAQDGAALHRCLGELNPERRRVLLLAYLDGLSQSEIALRLATPLGTVKAWTRRSLLALRECLQ